MRRLSRFVYGATDWTTSLPVRAWTPVDATVGGRRVSAAGVPATYIVRRDTLIELVLRLTEDEWEDVLALVAFGQTGQAITWYPDANNTDPDYEAVAVYLETPAPGERFTPTRDGQYPRMIEVTLVFRGVAGILPWTPYYNDD